MSFHRAGYRAYLALELSVDGIKIDLETIDTISVVHILGFVDTTTSPELEKILQGLLKEKKFHIVMDLGGVDYISSAGWGIFISEIKEIREHGGDLKLARMSSDVNEVFELLEFGNILQSFQTVDEALKAFAVRK
jgi:anti-anti-sigma factor